MFKQISLVCAVLFVAIKAEAHQSQQIPHLDECINMFKNVTEADKKLFQGPPMPPAGGPPTGGPPPMPTISDTAYCVVGCVMKKNNVVDTNNKLVVNKAMEIIQSMKPPTPPAGMPSPPPIDLNKVKSTMTTCAGNIKDYKGDCDFAKTMMTCVKDQLKMPLPFMGIMF